MTSAMITTIPDEEDEKDDFVIDSFTSAKIRSELLDLRMIHLATGQPSRVLLSFTELETLSNLISLPQNPDLNFRMNNIEYDTIYHQNSCLTVIPVCTLSQLPNSPILIGTNLEI